MSAPFDCPSVEGWQALFDDAAPPEQRDRYERHLESCPACQKHLDQAEGCDDTMRHLLQRAENPTGAPADPTLAQFLERMSEETYLDRATAAEPADLYFLRPTERPGVLGTLGEYEVREVLGQGGMGVVLKAYDPALHRLVAIKVLAPALAASPNARRRFSREARAAAAVCHEHVVAVHGVHEADGRPYLVMQYVAGESLQQRLDRAGPLEVEEVVRIGMQAASGLAAAHALGLIHRDVKPANLLLEDGPGKVKITDFGLARAADDVGLTQAGVVAGTPEYMAPEQARGEAVDPRADLFSLGSVLYACCTGHPPFRGPTPLAVLRQVNDEAPRPVRERNPHVPAWLEAFIARLLAKDPAGRLQTAAEVAALLEGYLAHLRQPATVPAPHLPPAPHTSSAGARVARRSSAWRPVLVLLSLVLAAGVILLAQQPAGPVKGGAPEEFYYDFRGQPLPPELLLFGENQFLRFEPEGLRITLPKDRKDLEPVCIAKDFEAVGDFEITTTFEILDAETPPPSYGVGASLLVRKAPPWKGSATVSRLVRVKGQQIVLWDQALEVPGGGGDLETASGALPCADKVGRLRLERTGTTVRCSWAPGTAGQDFQEIHRCDFGGEAIGRVVVSGVTGRKPCALDVRIADLRIRATPPAGPPAVVPPKGNWTPWLALALVIPLSVGVWLAVRRGRRTGVRQAKPGAVPAPVAFACPGCGRSLQARRDLVGKKVKCRRCGHATLVPGTTGGESAAAPS